MALSSFLAQLFGIFFLLGGISLILNTGYYEKALLKLVKDEASLFITGLSLLTAGAALVLAHNIWTPSWVVIITVIGWAMVIKGFLSLAIPRRIAPLYEYVIKIKGLMVIASLIWIILGLVLGYFGFYA